MDLVKRRGCGEDGLEYAAADTLEELTRDSRHIQDHDRFERDAYIQKLERRIHHQRVRLRWWEDLFISHVQSKWALVYLNWRSKNRQRYLNAGR